MAEPNYTIDYENDPRLTGINDERDAAIEESDATYQGMIDGADSYYNAQIDATKNWETTQKDLQQQQTDFAIEQINQQKDQAKTDYTKEQSGAYVDWQKQSNQYGANAEQMAAQGMANTGYTESSQVAMYNQYQNRVMAARESYNRAVLNYDNAIKDAQLQNNAALAQIAYESLQKQLELSLAGFQYKNTLLLEKAATKREISNNYFTRWASMLDQINAENSLKEQVRHNKFNEDIAERAQKLDEKKFAYEQKKNSLIGGVSGGVSGGGSGGGGSTSGGKVKGGRKGSTSTSSSAGAKMLKTSPNSNESAVNKDATSNTVQPTVDMKSVNKLGYGPISADRLSGLVADNRVTKYVEDNKIKFKKNPGVRLTGQFKTFSRNNK